MTQPAVNITEQDGALGVLPPSSGKLYACVGAANAGPINAPATYARVRDLVATFGGGPVVEAAARHIDVYGKPVVIVRSASSATSPAGTVSAVDSDADGTSVVTVQASPNPTDDLEIVVKIITGGTRGVAGVTFRVSLDNTRNFGPVTALGTATSIEVSEGVSFDLAAGTFVAGDTHSARAFAPNFSSADLGDALDALGATAANWEIAHIVGPVDSDALDTIEIKFAAMFARGKERAWIANTRVPNALESEAQYATAMNTGFSTKATKFGSLCAGATKLTSSVSGRKYRRPVSYSVGALTASVSEEINIADVAVGLLPGVSIRDINGNADEHDESLNPGLDDARFCVLRTIEGYQGVYVNRPRLFSPEGSDFQLMPHRRVLNLAHAALRVYFIRRLNKPIIVSKTTGFILDSEALEIEAGAIGVMRDTLLAKPKASAVQFALSRTDNLLSTKTLNGQGRVVPLAYPEFINLDVGFYNPALQVVAV